MALILVILYILVTNRLSPAITFMIGYCVLLIVSVICCTPLIEKLWDVLRKNVVTRCAAILTLLVVSTAYVVGSTNSPFLYFNF